MFAVVNRKKIFFYSFFVIASVLSILVAVFFFHEKKEPVSATDVSSMCALFLTEKNISLQSMSPASVESTRLADEFGDVMEEYNSLQKKQGFDLLPFAGKSVFRYTFKVNDKKRDDVVAVVFVYGGEIIGGDIHCTGVDGYMTGFNGEK